VLGVGVAARVGLSCLWCAEESVFEGADGEDGGGRFWWFDVVGRLGVYALLVVARTYGRRVVVYRLHRPGRAGRRANAAF
jgi:hypothetical protein